MKRWFPPMIGALIGTFMTLTAVPAAYELVHRAIPVERWFEAVSVDVQSTVVGTSPNVAVERHIYRPFTATWTVTIRKQSERGFEYVCARRGENDYRPYATLLPNTDLDWWLNVPDNRACDELGPGFYIVTIVWVVQTEGLPPKVQRAQSNIFEVTQ